MANKRISELTAATSANNADLLAIVQDGETKKITVGNLIGYSYIEVPISSAQILAMSTTPIPFLPQPAANKYYEISKIILELTEGNIGYDITGIDSLIIQGFSETIAPSFIENGFDRKLVHHAVGKGTVVLDYGAVLFLAVPYGVNPTVGEEGINGTMLAKILYKIKTFGTEL